MGELRDVVAPWELLDGYSSATELMRVADSPIPETITPFLIDLLKVSQDKDLILEVLYELSRYIYVDDSLISAERKEDYDAWAKRLRATIHQDLNLYITLQNSEFHEVQQAAKDLVKLLTTHKSYLE